MVGGLLKLLLKLEVFVILKEIVEELNTTILLSVWQLNSLIITSLEEALFTCRIWIVEGYLTDSEIRAVANVLAAPLRSNQLSLFL